MGFLVWLEATGLADWVRMSIPGYPSMIALHAIGMAVMVGLSLVIDLRVLGWFAGIPLPALQRFFGLAWVGFGINFLSGSALFSAQATSYIVDWVFMTKMTLVRARRDDRGDPATGRRKSRARWKRIRRHESRRGRGDRLLGRRHHHGPPDGLSIGARTWKP